MWLPYKCGRNFPPGGIEKLKGVRSTKHMNNDEEIQLRPTLERRRPSLRDDGSQGVTNITQYVEITRKLPTW
jgi:hypothetical protein